MILENWAIVSIPSDPYQPPELWPRYLQGNVFGHHRFEDGTPITTSKIMSVSVEDKTITTYSGSVYTLGAVDPEYEKVHPNAAERVWQSPAVPLDQQVKALENMPDSDINYSDIPSLDDAPERFIVDKNKL
jgi:hypothetical protein